MEAWHEALDKMKGIKNAYFLGMGDYEDTMAAKERSVLANSNIHESTKGSLYKWTNREIEQLAKELLFMKGRILGLLGGNHYMIFEHGITGDQKLCELLQTKYLGCCSFISLNLNYSGNTRYNYMIWAHHGRGAARTPGGDINRVEQMREAFEADAYFMAHSHTRKVEPVMKFELVSLSRGEPYIRDKVQWLCRTGSFLNAYVPGMKSYIVDAAKNAHNLGCVKLELTLKKIRRPKEDRSNYRLDSIGGYI